MRNHDHFLDDRCEDALREAARQIRELMSHLGMTGRSGDGPEYARTFFEAAPSVETACSAASRIAANRHVFVFDRAVIAAAMINAETLMGDYGTASDDDGYGVTPMFEDAFVKLRGALDQMDLDALPLRDLGIERARPDWACYRVATPALSADPLNSQTPVA